MNPAANANDQEIPESGFLRVENSGEAYQSIGWRFSPDKLFNRTALFAWLSGLGVERAKGVFITREGVFGYNLTSDTMTEMELDDCSESRLEIIFRGSKLVDENELLQCIEK